MKIADLKNKKILILGLGREGLATLRYLKKHLPEQKITVADRSEEAKETLAGFTNLETQLGEKYLANLDKFDLVIKTPGINPRTKEIEIARENGVVFTSATNLFFSEKQGKVIGVSGTKGKSTTSSLIYEIIKAGGFEVDLIGNIGKAALDFLENDNKNKLYVFEMSSYQLEDFQGLLDMAVLISFFPEHLDYHQNIENYFEAKTTLLRRVKEQGVIIYNSGFEKINGFIEKIRDDLKSKKIKEIAYAGKSKYLVSKGNIVIDGFNKIGLTDIKLLGEHNLENMLAAFLVGKELGIGEELIWPVMKRFQGLEHRLEYVGRFREIDFYNDSISTTPESAVAALKAIGKNRVGSMIVGGLDRGYEFGELAKEIDKMGVESLITFPETGEKIAAAVENDSIIKIPVNSMQDAIEAVYKTCKPGKICLLSCASPSYNLFINFEDRGRQFKEFVKKLG